MSVIDSIVNTLIEGKHEPEADCNGFIDCTCGWQHYTNDADYWGQKPYTQHLIDVMVQRAG